MDIDFEKEGYRFLLRASAIIYNEDKTKVLIFRVIGKDYYLLPGGRIGALEDSLTAVKREIKEELGVDILPEQLTLIGTRKSSSRPGPTFINNEFNDVYLLRLSLDVNKVVLQEEEVSEIRYVPIDELRQMIKNRDNSLLMHDDEFQMLFTALGYQL